MEGSAEAVPEFVEAARTKYLEAADWDDEADGFRKRMKDAQERAESCRAEAQRLVMEGKKREDPQLAIPEEPPCPESDKGHTWERIREGEMILEDCVLCKLERTAKVIPGEDKDGELKHEPWIYTKPADEMDSGSSGRKLVQTEEPAAT